LLGTNEGINCFSVARTRGSRNADYDEARLALARKARARVMEPDGLRASLRELAVAAESSVATLRHYFGDREGLLTAVMESQHIDAAPHLAMASTPIPGDVRASLTAYLQRLSEAWFEYGVGVIQASSLASGLSSRALGPAYVNHVLEPLLGTVETLLRRHVDLGDLAPLDERHAALQLLSPVVLALFHQDSLSGNTCRPLDLEAFFVEHVDMFLRAYPPRVSDQRAQPTALTAARPQPASRTRRPSR
jgi:AcrR family transcriptional regulator